MISVSCAASSTVVMTRHRLPEQRVLPIHDGRRRRSIQAAALDVDDDDLRRPVAISTPLGMQ